MNSNGRTVGHILRNAREQMGVSLEDAARATSIKTVYLQELENDHPEKFTSEVQARGFLHLYAKFLRLPFDDLVALWHQSEQEHSADQALTSEEPVPPLEEAEEIQPSLPEGRPNEAGPEASPFEDIEDTVQVNDTEMMPQAGLKGLLARISASIASLLGKIKKPAIFKSLRIKPPGIRQTQTAEATVPAAKESAQNVFSEIGAALREQRLKMQLDLSDIEQFTNIKRMYLNAIEDGRFDDLPSTVQGRGMLNIYAQFLAMDESAVMDRFARALQIQREELRAPRRQPAQPPLTVKVNLPPAIRRVLNPDLIVGGMLIVALFAFIIWGANLMLSGNAQPTAEAPSISEVLQTTPSATPLQSPPASTLMAEGNGEPEAEAELPAGAEASLTEPTPIATINAAPLQLYIIAHDRAYMHVEVDGREVFNGRTLPDNVYTYSGQNLITLLTGSGAALEVYFNQEYLGNLGRVGEVVNLRFTLEGLASPTPTPQLTPTQEIPPEDISAE